MNVPKLRFKDDNGLDFSEWEEKTLGYMSLKVGSGSTPLGGEKVYQSFGIPFIRSQNVTNDRLMLDDVTYISEEINVQMRNSIVKSNDILLNITGASIGRSCVVPSNFQTGNVNQHVCIIRLKEDYSSYFVQCFLTSENGQKLISYSQVGSGREGLNFQEIRKFKLFIPSFKEQTKIANFLSAVDDKIAELTQKIALLKRYKKGAMQQIFSQQLRFKDDNGQDFPEWEEKTLGEISNIYDGTHMTPDYQKSGIPFYSVEHITSNNFANTKFIAQEVFERENKRVKLEKGDLLMTKIGDIGTVKYIDWDVEASFYVSLALIKQSEKANFLYVSHYIRTGAFQRELHNRTIHVAFPKKINLGEIGNCIVKLPCEKEQTKIANFLSALDEQINTSQQQLDSSKQYKQSLLQQMFI